MFLGRKMPEAAKKLIRRTVSAIPDIFRNSQNEPVDYKALVQDLKKDFYKELAEVYPEYKIIRKEEIFQYSEVLGIRFYAGRDESFYTVFGKEVFRKRNPWFGGKHYWSTYSDRLQAWEDWESSDEGRIPGLYVVYCGCCGDVNHLCEAEWDEEVYICCDKNKRQKKEE